MEMTLDEVVREMNDLEQHMRKFEWKYSIKSAEFYRLVLAGMIEESFELHEWLGLYKLWLDFHSRYLELLKSPSPLLPLAKPLEEDFLVRLLATSQWSFPSLNPCTPQTHSSRYQTPSHPDLNFELRRTQLAGLDLGN